MATTDASLTALLAGCVVRVRGERVGAGFFIAPGVVLTCAHVAGSAGARVAVRWADDDLAGAVLWAVPADIWSGPYPNLAVVALIDVPSHPVALLDDHLLVSETPLVVVDRSAVRMSAARASAGTGGWPSVSGRSDGDRIRLVGAEIPTGALGAPVLNADTGGVCAVVTGTDRAEALAVPVRALRAMEPRRYRALRREHDRYHRRNRRWVAVVDGLPRAGRDLDGRTERELRGLLAGLPEANPDHHLAAYRRVVGAFAVTPRHPLLDYGDVVTELAELLPSEDGFPWVIAYVIDLVRTIADPELSARLRVWARTASVASGVGDVTEDRLFGAAPERATPSRSVPSIMVRVSPAGHDRHRYRCTIWRYIDETDITPVVVDATAVSLDELRFRLRTWLADLVGSTPAGNGAPMIEFIVPVDLMDEAVDRWQDQPDRTPRSTFGRRYPVVVRDLERFDEEDAGVRRWRARWDAMAGRDISTVLRELPLRDCADRAAALVRVVAADTTAVPVMRCSPRAEPSTRTALEQALSEGMPIAIWHRSGCSGTPDEVAGTAEAADRLTAKVRESLTAAHRDDVPERVRAIRVAAESAEPEPGGRDIVLLWDDPQRRPPRRPMVYPE